MDFPAGWSKQPKKKWARQEAKLYGTVFTIEKSGNSRNEKLVWKAFYRYTYISDLKRKQNMKPPKSNFPAVQGEMGGGHARQPIYIIYNRNKNLTKNELENRLYTFCENQDIFPKFRWFPNV